jgi:hypothetical protein
MPILGRGPVKGSKKCAYCGSYQLKDAISLVDCEPHALWICNDSDGCFARKLVRDLGSTDRRRREAYRRQQAALGLPVAHDGHL